MRRLFAALLVVAVAFALVACGGGGGGGTTEQTTTDQGAAAVPPPAAPAEGEVAVDASDLSPTETTEVAPFPTGSEVETIVPTAVKENLADDQAQLVLFYDSGQAESAYVRAQVDEALDDYRGLVALVSFDMSKAAPKDKAGDPELAKAALLADYLKVPNTPYIVLIDHQGLMTWRWRGPADAAMIDRELRRATD